jgi:transposase-like protein
MKQTKKYEPLVTKRFSKALKSKILGEIRSCRYTKAEACRVYGISGAGLRKWIKASDSVDLQDKVVYVKMSNEKDKVKEMKDEIRQLKEALANAHLKNIALESLIEAAEEHYKVDLKKNLGTKRSKK